MKNTKKTLLTILIVLALTSPTLAQNNIDNVLGNSANTIRADDIPAGSAGYSYVPGAAIANDNISAPTFSNTHTIGASIYFSRYRSCGEINPFKSIKFRLQAQIEEKIDKLKAIFQTIPQLIMDSAVEYAMAKINPTLNQLFTKKIDEYFELLQINIKSCEDVQRELSNNPNSNVFDELMSIAVADQWKASIGTGTFDNSARFKQKLVRKAQKEGLVMADGKRYGGEKTAPINFVKSLAKSGINLISGRNTTKEWDNPFNPTEQKEKPITKVFSNPDEIVKFIEDIYGSSEYKLSGGKTASGIKSKAGIGYYRRYVDNRLKIYTALKKYVNNKMKRKQFETETGVLVAPAVIEEIRLADPYARSMEIERLSKQYAIEDLKKKLMFARSALNAGVNAPDMKQSLLSGLAENAYRNLYFRIQDDLAELDSLKY
ncbi:MAG: hypothetical protein KGV46_02935 [Pasteurella sp.]|nr:hypothetical protein [Pasteurella sp.]